MVELRLKKKVAAFYSNCPLNRKYYGEIFEEDSEHISFRSVQCDFQGNMIYGILDRFLKLDVEYTKIWTGKEEDVT
jgi:hypothetical protein